MLALTIFAPTVVQAVPISGAIKFSGMVTLSKPDSMTSKLVFTNVMTTLAVGDYASIPVGTPVRFPLNLTFDDNTLETIPPQQFDFAFIEISMPDVIYEFNRPSLTTGNVRLGPPTWSFAVSGVGEAAAPGFQSNDMTFTLSGRGTAATVPFTGLFRAISPFPDGGSAVAFLGIALAGLEVLRRKLHDDGKTR